MAKESLAVIDMMREGNGDLLRSIVADAVREIMEAEVSARCHAEYGSRSSDRTNSRNGYRQRTWDTRAGTIELAIPRLREESYLPSFLEPRHRVERALFAVIAEAYVQGVSTRSVDALIKSMGATGVSKSHVSRICSEIEGRVSEFLNRPLEGNFPYVWLDATYVKVRQGGRVVDRAIVIAVGLNEEGRREVLGIMVGPCETEAFWVEFMRHLLDRGLRGVQLVVSDHHAGLRRGIQRCLNTQWQRCRVHFMRNLLSHTPKCQKGFVKTMVATAFQQTNQADAVRQWHAVEQQIREILPDVANLMQAAMEDVLAHMAHPQALWPILASTNTLERLNREVKRRADVVQIFPKDSSVVLLIGAVLMEQHDEWQVARRAFSQTAMGRPSTKDDAFLARGIEAAE